MLLCVIRKTRQPVVQYQSPKINDPLCHVLFNCGLPSYNGCTTTNPLDHVTRFNSIIRICDKSLIEDYNIRKMLEIRFRHHVVKNDPYSQLQTKYNKKGTDCVFRKSERHKT